MASPFIQPSVRPSVHKLRLYLHIVPILGILPSLLCLYRSAGHTSIGRTVYGEGGSGSEEYVAGSGDTICGNLPADTVEAAQLKAVSRQSVLLGLGCVSAMILLAAGASTQPSQVGAIRFLLASSFVGSGYFLVSLGLMFRVARDRSIRLPGVSQLSRRLP
ncbi:MAG: hypothetical protein AAFP20_16195 [Cyanobacteria bacterium J06614_10]